MSVMKKVLLSILCVFLSSFSLMAQDAAVEDAGFKKWENILEASLNSNYSNYTLSEYSIGLKYWFNEKAGLGVDFSGLGQLAFKDRPRSFSPVLDLGLAGAFRIIDKERSRLELNVGVGSCILASKSEYSLYCDCALRYGFLYDKSARVNPYVSLGVSYRHPYETDLFKDKAMMSIGIGMWLK